MAGTKGTIRLDDFVIPKNELRCSFIATSNHSLRDLDTYDGTESEEKIVSRVWRACWWPLVAHAGGAPGEGTGQGLLCSSAIWHVVQGCCFWGELASCFENGIAARW